MDQNRRQIIHQIRNALSPIQTLIQVVEIDESDAKLKALQGICKENLRSIQDLLQKLGEIQES